MDLIVVTGLMRSGTSLVASMLHTLGAPVARTVMPPPYPLTPFDWEDSELAHEMNRFAEIAIGRGIGDADRDAFRRFYSHYLIRRKSAASGAAIADKSPILMLFVPEVCELAAKLFGRCKIIRVTREKEPRDESVRRSFGNPDNALKLNEILAGARTRWEEDVTINLEILLQHPSWYAEYLSEIAFSSTVKFDSNRLKPAVELVERGEAWQPSQQRSPAAR